MIYIVSYGMGWDSKEVYITLQDVQNKKYYHISNSDNEEVFKIDSITYNLHSKYYKFIFASIENKNCEALIKYSDHASISGVYMNDVIYEIINEKTIRKCEFKKFDLLD
ncbi:hypothetical protein GCM10011343_09680 [Flavobacterium orientale]|uniref:Uncharacterized protein n=2 Tax=Flavobacterium orientale TaxID=1756020 RepID=A0A917DA78_9FLAO|nr:hypothetical protein GCM10011343_09680 [Flavobacterium orientale]